MRKITDMVNPYSGLHDSTTFIHQNYSCSPRDELLSCPHCPYSCSYCRLGHRVVFRFLCLEPLSGCLPQRQRHVNISLRHGSKVSATAARFQITNSIVFNYSAPPPQIRNGDGRCRQRVHFGWNFMLSRRHRVSLTFYNM